MAWVVRGCDTRTRALNCADLAPLPTCFSKRMEDSENVGGELTSFPAAQRGLIASARW